MWELLNTGDPGHTIGTCRLDRVFFSIETLEGLFLKIVGDEADEEGIKISDHNGLFGKVKLKKIQQKGKEI